MDMDDEIEILKDYVDYVEQSYRDYKESLEDKIDEDEYRQQLLEKLEGVKDQAEFLNMALSDPSNASK